MTTDNMPGVVIEAANAIREATEGQRAWVLLVEVDDDEDGNADARAFGPGPHLLALVVGYLPSLVQQMFDEEEL